jgi:hypothetical protein
MGHFPRRLCPGAHLTFGIALTLERLLRSKERMEALPVAAIAAGVVVALLHEDTRTSEPVLVAAGASYCLLHLTYV